MIDPLLPHLLDIVSDPASEGLILAGGFGIRLKMERVRTSGLRTLITDVPPARATRDLDFFLSLSLFAHKERGAAVRDLLNRLGYSEYTPNYQFEKPLDSENPERKVRVDLLARPPGPGDGIRVKGPRVKRSGLGLHGRVTPEAFAVENNPTRLDAHGARSDGGRAEASVFVPHPYAWLNMKVKAAHDWLEMERGKIPRKPNSERHVFDVYVLTAMLTEAELDEAAEYAGRYADHAQAADVRRCAIALFGSNSASGTLEAARQCPGRFEGAVFDEAIRRALGIC